MGQGHLSGELTLPTGQEVKGGSDDPHQLLMSFNYLLHKYLIHLRGRGLLVWLIYPLNRSGGDRRHSLRNNYTYDGDYFNFKI